MAEQQQPEPILAEQQQPDPILAEQQQPDPLLRSRSRKKVANAAPGDSPERTSTSDAIEIEDWLHLILSDEGLIIRNNPAEEPPSSFWRQNKPFNPNRIIPYHNILWAFVSPDGDRLVIHFAKQVPKDRLAVGQDKDRLKVAELNYPILRPLSPARFVAKWVRALMGRAYQNNTVRAKRAYVLINPRAGKGEANKIWDQQVQRLFEYARMHCTVRRTERAGHAAELAEQLDVDAYDVVVVCSGDGLVHEVFNGLGRRKDARRALSSVAVCHIPCGSGNAMSCNLYGTHKPSLAALAIIKGVLTPLDLVSVTHGNERKLSFLSQALGIVAAVDLGTEMLRLMGPARFKLGFMAQILRQKVYPCDVAVRVEIDDKEAIKEHYRLGTLGLGPGASLDGDGPASVHPSKLGEGSGSGNSVGGQSEAAASSAAEEHGLPPLRYGTVMDDLPQGWEYIAHENLGNFYCGNMAYMTSDANFFPATLPHDGLMDLVMIDGKVSPIRAIKLQTSVEKGLFFENPLVSYRKVSAYRIVPRNGVRGYVSIDGERAPFEPFQAEVHRGLGRTLSANGSCYKAPGPRGWDPNEDAEPAV